MRGKLAMFFVMASVVAGCSATPPPPAPMVMADPAPAPAPMMAAGPMDGIYKGTVMATEDSGPRCRKMGPTATTRVRGGNFVLGGMRGKVGADGSVMTTGKKAMSIGTLSDGTLDVTTKTGKCGYHYTLTHA